MLERAAVGEQKEGRKEGRKRERERIKTATEINACGIRKPQKITSLGKATVLRKSIPSCVLNYLVFMDLLNAITWGWNSCFKNLVSCRPELPRICDVNFLQTTGS
jgi:hypothetical protein